MCALLKADRFVQLLFFVVFMELCSGLSWDVYDGERQRLRPNSLSPDQV